MIVKERNMTGDMNIVFEDDIVRLEPFEIKNDIETVLDLIEKCKHTRVKRETARKALLRFNTIFWYVYDKKTKQLIGVIYLTNMPGGWMFDAYRDDELVRTMENKDYAYRAGKFVLDFASKFTNRILTMHAWENRGATMLCRKLGFKEDFITMKKEK